MPVVSAGAYFRIGDASNVLTDISTYLSRVTPNGDTNTFTASVFNPGASLPTQTKGYGATERTYTLTGWWDQTLDTLMEAISGLQNRNFEYGPEGSTTGKRKYSGTVNVGVWNGPGEQDAEGGFIPFEIEVAIVTRTVGTF